MIYVHGIYYSRIGYIGDVTKVEERTALMSILSGKTEN